ncbi:hypothetical protein EXIGLDRAFT_839887 [Exidia glandulosa HHB12029]|uniref:Uncharacterized protein n=1 Tax=Exidia glandulosa HHB12029 TaxID=1314781 RepID=A0A165ERP8_EXIGL|nr:hypothetical protein EXIGLDRAFT_839887 [Exidia glandulosa HHB12029]
MACEFYERSLSPTRITLRCANTSAGRGISAPLNWYQASTTGNHSGDDKDVVAKLGDKFPAKLGDKFPVKITQPVLFIARSRLKGLDLNTSHWAFLEQPDIVNAEIEKWLAVKV